MQDIMAIYRKEECIDFVKVGKRIKETRKHRHMTQASLASICGCSNNHVSVIETRVNKPSIKMIMKISVALDKSVDYFLMNGLHIFLHILIGEKFSRYNVLSLQWITQMLDTLLEHQIRNYLLYYLEEEQKCQTIIFQYL